MKRLMISAVLLAATALANAGVIVEDRPVSLSFQPNDKFAMYGIIMEERVLTTMGQTLDRGTYAVTVEGTGRVNEVLVSFSRGLGQPTIAQTKATMGKRAGFIGGASPGAIRGFQDVDDRPVFSRLGFSALSHVASARDGGHRKITIESATPSVNVAVEMKLTVVP